MYPMQAGKIGSFLSVRKNPSNQIHAPRYICPVKNLFDFVQYSRENPQGPTLSRMRPISYHAIHPEITIS